MRCLLKYVNKLLVLSSAVNLADERLRFPKKSLVGPRPADYNARSFGGGRRRWRCLRSGEEEGMRRRRPFGGRSLGIWRGPRWSGVGGVARAGPGGEGLAWDWSAFERRSAVGRQRAGEQ